MERRHPPLQVDETCRALRQSITRRTAMIRAYERLIAAGRPYDLAVMQHHLAEEQARLALDRAALAVLDAHQ